MRTLVTIILLALLGAGIAGGLFVMSQSRKEPERKTEEPRGLVVFVTQASKQDVPLNVSATGQATPRRDIIIAAQVGGRIAAIADSFESGGMVSRGDLLMQIEDADYRLAVTRARAEVARAERALELERAQADLARRDWQELGEGQASALTLREPQLAEAEANLEAAKASLRDAELQLSRTRVRAPFDGLVRSKDVDIGQFVNPGMVAGRMFATDVMEVRLPLSDDDLSLLGLPLAYNASSDNPGPAVTLSANVAGAMRRWQGQIVRTDSAIDPQTRTLSAVAQVQDPYGEGADGDMPLAAGLFVNAEIVGAVLPGAYVLPRAALRGDRQVLVAEPEGKLSIREVSVAYSDRERAVLTAGVSDGEYVITSPVLSPSDGMKIEAFDATTRELLFPIPEEEPDADATDEEDGASAESDNRRRGRG